MTVGLIEVDAGDAPSFSIAVAPHDGTTAVTAAISDPAGTPTPFSVATADGGATWEGTGPILSTAGEYTATFTVTGTGAGMQYVTVVVEAPPPLSTDLRRVRLLIPDTNPAARLFRVDELSDFMAMESGVKKAAALALETIASSEVMVSKVITSQDLSTDGAKVSDALLKRAAMLRQQADDDDPEAGGGLDVIDFRNPFNRRYGGELTEPEWC